MKWLEGESFPTITSKVLNKCVTTGGTVPAPHVAAFCEVYRRSANLPEKKKQSVNSPYTTNGEIIYRWLQSMRHTTKYVEMQ